MRWLSLSQARRGRRGMRVCAESADFHKRVHQLCCARLIKTSLDGCTSPAAVKCGVHWGVHRVVCGDVPCKPAMVFGGLLKLGSAFHELAECLHRRQERNINLGFILLTAAAFSAPAPALLCPHVLQLFLRCCLEVLTSSSERGAPTSIATAQPSRAQALRAAPHRLSLIPIGPSYRRQQHPEQAVKAPMDTAPGRAKRPAYEEVDWERCGTHQTTRCRGWPRPELQLGKQSRP